ncbi:sugar ABC transporter ATP-binding protein [Lawsonibacter hominis]|uniref:sugar ABC transporter ATP-binding protein n=1 Tax=Lawsonibacter hominis TaxID=2763053 RepID=UPI0033326BEF
MSDNILEIKGLTKLYPGVVALDHVDLSVRRGEVHAIVGENGAGKSTLIKSITGAIVPDEGVIRFDGKEYTHLEPKLSSDAGIGVIYQEFNLVPGLTVAENVFMGNYAGNGVTVDFKTMRKRAEETMDKVGVRIPADKMVSELTVGHQQIVEIMRSLVKEIKLLIMDEPTAPLTANEVEQLFKIVNTLRGQGITIIYISHRMEEIFELADRVSVMRDGTYITTLDVDKTNIKELIQYMVGRELRDEYPQRNTPIGGELLRAEHLSGNGVEDISFTLHKGEILGFAGLLGCGRTETIELLYGAKKRTGGKVFLNGKEINVRNTTEAMKLGLGLVPEDRKRTGAFLNMTIVWNTGISCIKKKLVKGLGVVDTRKERALAEEYVKKLRTKTPSVDQWVANLSGGNQQKVVVAKMLATDADILIFDEPTRGIDVGAKQEMYQLIRQLVDEGKSVILISSEMGEVMGLSDRIVVLYEGRQMGVLEREAFSQEKILSLASGVTT